MLGVVGQQYCVRLHRAASLTGFKLCATESNNLQQGVQTDATCNIQQCWELLANNVGVAVVIMINNSVRRRCVPVSGVSRGIQIPPSYGPLNPEDERFVLVLDLPLL